MVQVAPADGARPASSGSRPCAHGLDLSGRYQVGSLIRTDGRCCTHHAHDVLLRRAVSVTLATPPAGIPVPSTFPLPTSARDGHGPGLGEIYDGGDDHGTLYLVVQAPADRTLADELSRHRLNAGEVRHLGAGIARALLPAHRHGWTHGALEADTVGLGPDRVTVVGLGVGEWLEHWAHVAEPPRHPAPEQLTDAEISPATDVFALGALLAAAAEPLPSGDPLAALLRRMCAEDPAERPSTEQVLRLLTAPAPEPVLPPGRVALSPRPTAGGTSRSRARAAALGGLAVAATLAVAVLAGTAGVSSDAGGATLSALSGAPVRTVPLPLPASVAEAGGAGALGAGALGAGDLGAGDLGAGALGAGDLAAVDPVAPSGRSLIAATGVAPTAAAVARRLEATAGARDGTTTSPSTPDQRPDDDDSDSPTTTAVSTSRSTAAPTGSTGTDGSAPTTTRHSGRSASTTPGTPRVRPGDDAVGSGPRQTPIRSLLPTAGDSATVTPSAPARADDDLG
jgi:eukaryotic-like serine/threonine-protein kinase